MGQFYNQIMNEQGKGKCNKNVKILYYMQHDVDDCFPNETLRVLVFRKVNFFNLFFPFHFLGIMERKLECQAYFNC